MRYGKESHHACLFGLYRRWICCLLALSVLSGNLIAPGEAETQTTAVDYHRCSAIMLDAYGERVVSMARETIDAFLAGDSSVILHGYEEGDLPRVIRCIATMCPLYAAFTYFDEDCFDEKTCRLSWINFCTPDELAVKQALLEETVTAFLRPIEAGDSDLLIAADLYYRYTAMNTYNERMTEEGAADAWSLQELTYIGSSYQAIVEHTAICYGLSDGLTFLYTQAGLNAVTVGCFLSDQGAPAHDWVMVQLDGCYYYVDPTWDLPYGADHAGLLYFGMTAEDRYEAGGYAIAQTELFGNDDSFDMTAYGLDDSRFSILREERFRQVQSLTPDHERQCLIVQAADDREIEIR